MKQILLIAICSNAIGNLLEHKKEGDPVFAVLQQKGYNVDLSDDASLMARSPIYHIANIEAPMFILHRKGNPILSEQESIDFHNAMISAGKSCQLVLKERGEGQDEQKLSFQEIIEESRAWIDGFLPQSLRKS